MEYIELKKECVVLNSEGFEPLRMGILDCFQPPELCILLTIMTYIKCQFEYLELSKKAKGVRRTVREKITDVWAHEKNYPCRAGVGRVGK
jgi:hypothetical protein